MTNVFKNESFKYINDISKATPFIRKSTAESMCDIVEKLSGGLFSEIKVKEQKKALDNITTLYYIMVSYPNALEDQFMVYNFLTTAS